MANLRFYKDIYCIDRLPNSSADTYTLITPDSITAQICESGDTTIIESGIPMEYLNGRFFVDLTPNLYSSDKTYLIKWNVRYVPLSPIKILPDYFMINPFRIGACEFIVHVDNCSNKGILQKFLIKQNDTLPSLTVNIRTRGCLHEIIPFRLESIDSITFTMSDSCGNKKVYNQPVDIISSEKGQIEYRWIEGDTDEVGRFIGEFEIIYSDGNKLSLPTIGGINIEILKDINEQ